jgi:protein TonB
MLAYAANRPRVAASRPSPNAMLAIIAAHITVIAVVMSAKMELPQRIIRDPVLIQLHPDPPPPPPNPIDVRTPTGPVDRTIDQPTVRIPTQPVMDPGTIDPPPLPNIGDLLGGAGTTGGNATLPPPLPVKIGPRLATPDYELRPPYPQSKIMSGEEAVLTLRLTIDQHGRVVAVSPVARADAAFLEAARRHLLAHWRYKPASEDGRAIASSTVVTLHFELDG